LLEHFPDLDLEKADRWSEVMGFTTDGLPLLGRLPSLPQAYFAVGFGGHGLSWAFVAAERLVSAMLHDAELGLLSARRLDGDDSS
jgi:glycine/D-amino acid oxidase-like deaminating enzyme